MTVTQAELRDRLYDLVEAAREFTDAFDQDERLEPALAKMGQAWDALAKGVGLEVVGDDGDDDAS